MIKIAYTRMWVLLFLLLSLPLHPTYILVYDTIDNGGILFTGNTLGLSKAPGQNQPGTADSSGAFITTDTSQKVGNYLAGTTLQWQQDSSKASLDLPPTSTVLHAELIWSGSYGFQNQITGNEPNSPIKITTPEGNTFTVTPNPATAQTALTPGYSNAGNYVRSADVTAIVQGGGAGFYTVGGIAGTISPFDDTHNAAGWTLAVAFHDGSMVTSNLTLFVACEQASSASSPPASVSGFCTPTSGSLVGQLYVSAIEGEANKSGDYMLFGNTPNLTTAANALSGVNNPVNNFFCSQINTLLPFNGTRFVGSAELDTRGSFGSFNQNPFTGQILPGSRQGYDITSVDVSSTLSYNQTVAYAKGVTSGDDYTINALGLQIQVGAPTLTITKLVNGTTNVQAVITDPLTLEFLITNNGTLDTDTTTTFFDPLDPALSFTGNLLVNGTPTAGDPTTGIPLGVIPIGESVTISFTVEVVANPAQGNVIFNGSEVSYGYTSCNGPLADLVSSSGLVSIELPFSQLPQLATTKFVNSTFGVGASIGDLVTFTTLLTNNGTGDALNVVFQDALQDGLQLVSGSVTIDGVNVSPDPDLNSGVDVGIVPAGLTSVVEFQALVTKAPASGSIFYNHTAVNYAYQSSIGVFTPADPAISNQVTINLAVDPLGFEGVLKACNYINKTAYCVSTTWVPAYSYDVVAYRIYSAGKLLTTVPAGQSSARVCGLKQSAAFGLTLTGVYPNNTESSPVPIRILQ